MLRLCAEPGLVRPGRVALDGTKLDANASKHKAMRYDRIVPKIEQLGAEVKALFLETERVDRAEDDTFGEDRRPGGLAGELARRESCLEKLRAAKEAIEADAREEAEPAARP